MDRGCVVVTLSASRASSYSSFVTGNSVLDERCGCQFHPDFSIEGG